MTTIKPITVNTEQELYVIPGDGGFSCLGFDVCIERACRYASWLKKHGQYHSDMLPNMERGAIETYSIYETLIGRISDYCLKSRMLHLQDGKKQIQCDAELTPQLVGLEHKRVEVVDKHGEVRRFWVGKSTGCIPIHLEIKRRNSHGGTGVYGAPFKSVTVIK